MPEATGKIAVPRLRRRHPRLVRATGRQCGVSRDLGLAVGHGAILNDVPMTLHSPFACAALIAITVFGTSAARLAAQTAQTPPAATTTTTPRSSSGSGTG